LTSLEVHLRTRQFRHHDKASSTKQPASNTDVNQPPFAARNLVLFSPGYHRWFVKLWFERLLAWSSIIVIGPFLLLLAILIRATSCGRAFLWQERVGLGGRVFQIVKLRSMFEDAEQWTGAVWALEDDPRITPLGRYLRKLHLDELPQIWNVARGEMSFIGPRPERPNFVDTLIDQVPGYECRLAVLPGVTGLAQVNLPPDQTPDCVRRKIELDLEYIFTAEPSMDLRIVFCTILQMFGVPRERAAKVSYIYRELSATSGPTELCEIDADLRSASDGLIDALGASSSAKHTWLNSKSLTAQG
jgi:lipopolysaccharide/colanic/teichoic acid biosynthesis glycosyltransferase